VALDEVDVGQGDVALDHVERRVAEDPLKAEHVAAIDEVARANVWRSECGLSRPVTPIFVLDHIILWFEGELAGEEGFEPSIS
jgi:hypothetical protein